MENLSDVLLNIGPYHWLTLAALLIGIEMIMPTQYLIWPGIAAAVVGLLSFAVDLSTSVEIGIFAALSAVLVGVSHFYMPKAAARVGSGLNQRTDQLVGRTAVVAEDFQHGAGPVTVGDSRWSAQAADGESYVTGTAVQIVSAESTLLKVKRV
jgi:membrane protein implicated in regulation of membrane protease activity